MANIIKVDLITIDSVKADHELLEEEILSLYRKGLSAHVSEKLSYDVIDLISLIDRVRTAALRYI